MIHKITLMDAYVIETIKRAGMSNEEIIMKIENKEVTDFETLHDSFDFTVLYTLAEKGVIGEVLGDGYKVTFLTFPGLINLLRLKFNLFEKEDYEVEGYVLSKLILTEEEEQDLRIFLSANWLLEKRDDGFVIEPVGNK